MSGPVEQQKGLLSGPSHSPNPYDPGAPQNNGFPPPPYNQPPEAQPYYGQPYQGQPYQQQWPPQNGTNPYLQHQQFQGQPPQQWPGYQYPPNTSGYPQQNYQPPPPGPYGQPQPYGFPAQQQPPFPQNQAPKPQNLSFRQSGPRFFTMVDTHNQVLYSFNFSFKDSGRGTLHVSRGENGPQCGSAQFHSLASKVDMSIGSAYVNFKKEFPSSTGQGFLVWRKDSESFWSGKGNLVLESQGSKIATFRLDKGPDNSGRQGGGMEIHKPGLSQSQLDEIVVSGVVELERRRISAASSSTASSAGVIVAIT